MTWMERIEAIIKILQKTYPRAGTALKHHSPFELLVATILSAQCTDERVNKIMPGLIKKYKNVRGFARAKKALLERDVRSTGFYRNKAKNIIEASKIIVNKFRGKVPDTMEELVTLPGVARKTANIVLSSAFGKAEGIAVDTHVGRLSGRLGLSKNKNPDEIEKDLLKIVPRKYRLTFNYLLVNHGRAVCAARGPRCGDCVIGRLCPSRGKV